MMRETITVLHREHNSLVAGGLAHRLRDGRRVGDVLYAPVKRVKSTFIQPLFVLESLALGVRL